MKTSKILLKIVVVLVLAIALFIPSTFSWYNHNGELSGREMSYHREGLPVSAGTVSAETKMYQMESDEIQGGSPNNVYYDQKGNKKYKSGELGSVERKTSQYYGTTFTNTGSAPAFVNLYLNVFKNSTNAYIGTLQPNLTHKGLSSSVHLANKNFIRVYFQPKTATNWQDNDAKYYVVYKTKTSSTAANREFSKSDGDNEKTDSNSLKYSSGKIIDANDTGNILKHEVTYYIDLPDNTTEFFFATDGNNSGFDTTTSTAKIPWYRTKTITNVQAETGYFLTGSTDDTTWNAQHGTFNIPGGVSVKTYFDKLTINNGQHAYVTLNQGNHYTGASATYSGTGITVNANTGLVSASGLSQQTPKVGTITTTVTGSLGDKTTVTTDVYNPETVPAVPVALNVKVPGGTPAEPGTAEVVWYIRNTGTSEVTFSDIYYTK